MFITDKDNHEATEAFLQADEIAAGKPITQVSLTNSLSGKAGGEALAQYLDGNPQVEELSLHHCPIADEGMAVLASAISRHPALQKFKATDSSLSPEGVAAFFEKGGFTAKTIDFALEERESPDANDAIKAHISRIASKNLLDVAGATTPEVKALVDRNNASNASLIETLFDADIKDLSVPVLRRVYERKDSLFYYEDVWNDVFFETPFNNTRDGDEDSAFVSARFQFAQDDLQDVLKTMPALPETPDAASLFTPNASGYAALDNPSLWEEKGMDAFKSIPLTQEILSARTPKGSSLLDSAIFGLPAQDVIGHLNAHGIHLRAGDLVDDKGKPSVLLAKLVEDDTAAALFTPENWLGAQRSEVYQVYNALPQAQQAKVGVQTLLQQTSTAKQGLGR